MIGHLFRITAKPGHLAELIEFMQYDAQYSAENEPGTLRFDVFPVPDDPDSIYLYEAYASQEAFDIHMAGEPCKKYLTEIAPNFVASSEPLFLGVGPVATNAA